MIFTLCLASNGIVIATEKKSSSILIDDSMIDKVAVICPNIGIVYSGMGPDFRVLIAKARKSAQSYWKIYGEYPPTRVLTQEIATVMQQATQSGQVPLCHLDSMLIEKISGVRPYGVSLLVAGWDINRGPTLYQVDPSGSFWAWKASAIGKNMVNAKTFLEKRRVIISQMVFRLSDHEIDITMISVWRMRFTRPC
jgi:20S proteasome subunit alpha 2